MNLRKTSDYSARRDLLAINSNCHHHQQCQTYFHAAKTGNVSLSRMFPATVAYRRLAGVPIPTSAQNHLGYRLGIMVTVGEHTYAWCYRLCVLKPVLFFWYRVDFWGRENWFLIKIIAQCTWCQRIFTKLKGNVNWTTSYNQAGGNKIKKKKWKKKLRAIFIY